VYAVFTFTFFCYSCHICQQLRYKCTSCVSLCSHSLYGWLFFLHILIRLAFLSYSYHTYQQRRWRYKYPVYSMQSFSIRLLFSVILTILGQQRWYIVDVPHVYALCSHSLYSWLFCLILTTFTSSTDEDIISCICSHSLYDYFFLLFLPY